LVIIIALVPLLFDSPYILHIFIQIFLYGIVTVSLRTINISGQFSLAHGAFMGIGAYTAGMASKWLGWSPWLTIPAGGILALGIGMLMAFPFSRLRALYYSMGSLFFGIAIIQMVFAGGTVTGSYVGLSGITPLFPNISTKTPCFYFFLVLFLVSIAFLYRFEFCRIGRTLKAIAQSHLVASSLGINEAWYRIMVSGVGCFFAGIAGASYAHYSLSIAPSAFYFTQTLWLVLCVLIGGLSSFVGPIIGTVILVIIPEVSRDLQIFSPYVSAAILLLIFFLMPQGLVGLPNTIRSWFTRNYKNKRLSDVS
jgi:branched-chain amino acid transport system permease protein